MNSLYGVLGWDKFRLYDSENAAAVTATGRAVINHTEKVANRLDYKVTYGDTDSVMLALEQLNIDNIATAPAPLEEEHPELTTDDGGVQVPDEVYEKYPDMDDAEVETVVAGIIKGFELEEEINAAYDAFARKELNAEEHRFLIENEKLYRRFFQAGKKKRYAGDIKWKEGHYVDKTDITGFEYKRSDSAPVTNRVQKETIDRIIAGQDHSEIRSWLHDEIEQVREGNVSIEDIGIPSGIGQPLDEYANPGSHPRGALYANAVLETNFGAGSKPKHVYLERVHPDFFQQFEQANGNGDGTVDLPPVRRRWYEKFRKDPDVICFEHEQQVPDEFYVDWDKMVEKTLKGPIERILIPIGISWDEVTSGQTQQALGSFM